MDNNLITWVLAVMNASWLIYQGWKKLKPEVKKMEGEAELDSIEAAAKSQQMLVDRINDLQGQLITERDARRVEIQQERDARRVELDAEKEARRKESEYLRRRLSEAEGETKAYRRWAAQLVKQVVEAGKVPAAFIPFSDESQTGIPTIKDEPK